MTQPPPAEADTVLVDDDTGRLANSEEAMPYEESWPNPAGWTVPAPEKGVS